jgi:hypothetical protein
MLCTIIPDIQVLMHSPWKMATEAMMNDFWHCSPTIYLKFLFYFFSFKLIYFLWF